MASDPAPSNKQLREYAEHRTEELEQEHPEGVPPAQETTEPIKYGVVILAAAGIAAIFLVFAAFGGLASTILAAVLVAVFAGLGAAPAWLAGVQRRRDEREVRQRVAEELRAQRQGREPAGGASNEREPGEHMPSASERRSGSGE